MNFVIHSCKFYMKYCWTNKGHFWNEKVSGFKAKYAFVKAISFFKFSVRSQIHQKNYCLLTLV